MKNFAAYVRTMLSKKAYLNVFAEENTDTETTGNETPETPETPEEPKVKETPPQGDDKTYVEEMLKKAREDEKAKLYPQIEKLKQDKKDLLDTIADRDATIAKLEKDTTKYKEQAGKLSKDLETGAKTNKTVSEMTLKVSQLERTIEDMEAAHQKELNTLKIDSLKEKKIASANGAIIPELVVGETEEEVEASFQKAVERYNEITNKAISNQTMPFTNPNSNSIQLKQAATLEEIQNMSPTEYAAYRNELGIK